MLKVMLVDDESVILQGLQILIDWEEQGYEIVATKSNGMDAIEYLKDNEVDLIISDIQMPVLGGLELLEKIRKEKLSDARFVVLTGYSDFKYTQKAIRYNCLDYILKPVSREDLLSVLNNVSTITKESLERSDTQEKMADAYLKTNILSLLRGKFDESHIDYVSNHLQIIGDMRYIDIELEVSLADQENDDTDYMKQQRRLFNVCKEIMAENATHFIFDASYDETRYVVGFIYDESMAKKREMTEKEFLDYLRSRIEVLIGHPVVMLCGKKVPSLSALSKSYGSSNRLNSLKGFHSQKKIYVYEEDMQVDSNASLSLCKNQIDDVIRAIEENDRGRIEETIEVLYNEIRANDKSETVMDLNINYLLFQLIHLASEKDDSINQDEIIRYISESSFDSSLRRGSPQHLNRFATEYASYLSGLSQSVSSGIMGKIDNEIKDHYSENISLRYLGDKFHINSSYLGQVFKRKHNMSFKNYLTNYRVIEASKLIKSTDKKINEIAESVGYKDCDYFIRKFIEIKGCTPSKYRKKSRDN